MRSGKALSSVKELTSAAEIYSQQKLLVESPMFDREELILSDGCNS